MTVRAALAAGAVRLAAAGVPDPARDVRRLMAEALGVEAGRLTLMVADPLPAAAGEAFERMLDERVRRRPVAQILGRRAFWGRDFAVSGAVLDPRPETETLIARALEGPVPGRILDLGTGSGAFSRHAAGGVAGRARDLAPTSTRRRWPWRVRMRRGMAWRGGRRFGRPTGRPGWGSDSTSSCRTRRTSRRPKSRGCHPKCGTGSRAMRLPPGRPGWRPTRRIAAGLAAVLAPGGRALFEVGAGQGAAVASLLRGQALAGRWCIRTLTGVTGSSPAAGVGEPWRVFVLVISAADAYIVCLIPPRCPNSSV